MNKVSIKTFVVLAAMVAFAAACHWMVWASPVSATAFRVTADADDPNDPQPGPEVAAVTWLDEDPNQPSDPAPGPEIVALAYSDEDPNEPDAPSPGPECI